MIGFPPHFNQNHKEIYKGILNHEPEYHEHKLSASLVNLLKGLLDKNPESRYQTFTEVKGHPWLADIDWERVYNRGYEPPIVPGPHQCCIDDEFLNLPLDFEDSSMPALTERRQSCYYESTIMLKTLISDKNTLRNSHIRDLYNNLSDSGHMPFGHDNASMHFARNEENKLSVLKEEPD